MIASTAAQDSGCDQFRPDKLWAPGSDQEGGGHRLVAELGGDDEDAEKQREQIGRESRSHQVAELLDGVGVVGKAKLAVPGPFPPDPPPPELS